jgi:hypothetical protein
LAIMFTSLSTATTTPVGPTNRATSIKTSPRPQPISRTRCLSSMPALRKSRRVKGSKSAAWRTNRYCSASLLPSK